VNYFVCLIDIRRFSTKSRLPYMKKYSREKSTGPIIWIQLLGITFRSYVLLFSYQLFSTVHINMLVAFCGKRNVTVWRPSVRLSVPSAHTQRDSPGGSTRRGQSTFPSKYYEDGHTC